MSEEEVSITVLRGSGNWEVIYVNGEEEYSNHLDRAWPDEILSIIDGKTVVSARKIDEETLLDVADEDDFTFSPDGGEIWEYPSTLPDELQ